MKKAVSALIVILVLGGGAYYFWQRTMETPSSLQPIIASQPATPEPPPPAEPEILYPVTDQPVEAASLPELIQSDAQVLKTLGDLIGRKWLALFVKEGIVRKIVATVDNLPRQQVPVNVMPLEPVPGAFRTTGQDDALAIASSNSVRYARYVALAKEINAEKLVNIYVQFYPLFQKAYQALGYPHAYFNDRLVVAIDDLLATPSVVPPVKLVQPKIIYQYADADLEQRSAGQKIMIRMGHDNAAQIKNKLREIRQLITRKNVLVPEGHS